jgi:CDP-6-deoxy-D-xylo-4-hexulose-3-dehydrase
MNHLSQSDIAEAVEVLNSGNLTMGKKVETFEKNLAEYLQVENFIMVNSGSSANLLIFEYLLRASNGKGKLKPGDGVLVPSIAWPTTIWPILQLGLKPVFVDVDRETFQIDFKEAELKLVGSKTPIKAIFPIHPLGIAINPNTLQEFSAAHGLVVVSDVCESLGSWSGGMHAGGSSLASSFSFYFSHHITTMEGGGVATNSLEMADDLRSMRSHGWSRNRTDSTKWTRGLPNFDSKFRFISTGYNFRPTEVQAAIGLGQIAKIDAFVERRRSIAMRVNQACSNTPVRLMNADYLSNGNEKSHSWMLLPLCVDSTIASKEKIQEYLENFGVETRPVLTGNFLAQPAISRMSGFGNPTDYPNASWVQSNCFLIGCHQDYSEEQIEYLTTILKDLNSQ